MMISLAIINSAVVVLTVHFCLTDVPQALSNIACTVLMVTLYVEFGRQMYLRIGADPIVRGTKLHTLQS